jgi:hypothetical protein
LPLHRGSNLPITNNEQRMIYSAQRGPLARLPGPEISKWTGWILTYHWLAGSSVYYVASLHEKYGAFNYISM